MEAEQLRLYAHFVATGQEENAAAILEVYPDFSKEVEAAPEEEVVSKRGRPKKGA